jgi:hypothetical protein
LRLKVPRNELQVADFVILPRKRYQFEVLLKTPNFDTTPTAAKFVTFELGFKNQEYVENEIKVN